MKKLFFEINGQIFKYTVIEYTEEDGFLIFTDTLDGKQRRFRKDKLISTEEVKP